MAIKKHAIMSQVRNSMETKLGQSFQLSDVRNKNYLHLFYICSTFILFVSLFVSFVLHPLSDSLLFIIISSSINSWYLYSHLISFVWSQGQCLTLLFLSSSFVFISHLTNFLSYPPPWFMFVACLFLCHFAFEKEPARFEM